MLNVRTTITAVAALAIASAALVAQTPKPAKPAGTAPAPKEAQAPKTATPKRAAAKPPAKHVLMATGDMKWGPAPDGLPPGSQTAVVDGDPSKAGVPFVIRAKMPDGYKVMPHWHPTDESITVISGALAVGMGDMWNDSSLTTLNVGDYGRMPKLMHHYALAKGETVIQIHGMGPFGITYVNPKDDPRKKTQ